MFEILLLDKNLQEKSILKLKYDNYRRTYERNDESTDKWLMYARIYDIYAWWMNEYMNKQINWRMKKPMNEQRKYGNKGHFYTVVNINKLNRGAC